jgi:hypothetical protein
MTYRINLNDDAKNMDPKGVIQFSEVKTLLINAAAHAQPHPINLAEIEKLESLEQQMKLEMERKMKEYFDKIAASWPSELKPGMAFGKKNGDALELTAPPRQLPGKTGDRSIVLKVKFTNGWLFSPDYETTMTRAELSVQNGWRFLKT